MELRQLRQFLAVVDLGGFSAAAAKLGMGQPTLSHAVATLEDELGVELLSRTPRGAIVTEAGAALYPHAQKLMRMSERTADVVHRRDERAAGRVRLGMPVSITQMIGPRLYERARSLYPEITLELFEHTAHFQAIHLLNERIDLCVLAADESMPDEIDSVALLHERLWFVRARGAGAELPRSVTLATVVQHPQVMTTPSTSFRAIVAREFDRAQLKPRIVAESNSGQTILNMVADGVGATLQPYSAFARYARLDELEYCLVEPAIHRYAKLAHSRHWPLTIACESIRALVRETAAHLIHSGQWRAATMSEQLA